MQVSLSLIFLNLFTKFFIALWTKDSRNENAILAIGQKMKQLLQLTEVKLQYQVHKDAMVQPGPNVNAIYKI